MTTRFAAPEEQGRPSVSTDANLIRADRFAEIGLIIERDAGLIIERWLRRAAEEKPPATAAHRQVLMDQLPSFLAELGRALAESGDPENSRHCVPAVEHGEQRWQAGWSLADLIHDYQLLRLVLLNYLDEVLERALELREVLAVGLALDEAIAASVVGFNQFCELQARRQTEALHDADRRKNEFLATLAHELRNPLAPLRSALDLIHLHETDPETVDQLVEIMDRQVVQMTRLVEDLLDMSRIALGKLTLKKVRLDARTAINQAVQTVSHHLQLKEHDLKVSLPSEPLWVDGDQGRLVQVFVNLLNNAIKYTPDRGKIALAAERQGETAVVRVRDNGIGIAPEMRSRIFEMFTQIDLGDGREDGGLGIGLSLVRRLVALHGGTIDVSSDGLRKGSEFSVTLPLVEPDGPGQIAEVPASARAAAGRKVLLIEDHADGRRSLALLLKLAGNAVEGAENGRRGLALAAANRPEVALVDIGLPDLDGYEVGRELRAQLGPEVFLVALTGYSQPEDRRKALESGFDAHLAKPVDLQTLQNLIASHFARRP
jgi:signal transduction histidine kinase/CheY-like chemotaxis protein